MQCSENALLWRSKHCSRECSVVRTQRSGELSVVEATTVVELTSLIIISKKNIARKRMSKNINQSLVLSDALGVSKARQIHDATMQNRMKASKTELQATPYQQQ